VGGGGHSDVTDATIVVEAGMSASGSPATTCGSNNGLTGCHNNKFSTPAWNTATPIACVDCHTVGGSNSATVANPVTGLHNITASTPTAHDETLVGGGCAECHTKSSIGGHWDGTASAATPDFTGAQVGITAMTGGSYTDAGGTATLRGTCATTCHSDGGGWGRQWSTAADSDATAVSDTRCGVCHGDYASGWTVGTSHEQTFGGSASTRGAGHNSGSGACEDCHSYPSVGANHNTATHRINVNEPGTGITEGGGRAWCADCHSDDGAPTTSGTHTITQSVFTLLTVDGANDPVGSCTGCHGTGGANYWPDNSTAHVANDEPGEHAAHIQLLARRVYNQSIAELIADGATDTKQKALCDYCHKATVQDGTHNNGTANVFPTAANALRFQDGASDTGTLASYDGGASGTCSSVDCHNSKANVPGTYGWYDAAVSDCVMCHTPGGHAEDFANPTTGLHNITPTTSGVTHDNTLAVCNTCHSVIPDNYTTQTSAHIDGTFPADTNSNTDRYLFADYVDGTPGTCLGGNSGAAGCHDGNGEVGTWKRCWSDTADNGGTVVCDNCHGGVNGEGTWTFGSNNTIGDNNMSHDRNWDGEGALEVIGQHSADTSSTDRCNTCHVYGDAEYGAFGWGGPSNHGNDKIDMNDSLGYSRSGGDAYGCTSNCHTTPGSHLTESSNWTLGAVAGPSLGCDSCHGGGAPAAGVDSTSPHTVSTFGGSFISCGECHPGDGVGTQHTASGVVSIPNNSNVGINYQDGVNSYSGYNGIVLGGTATSGSTEAEICWNCHDFNSNGNLNDANEPNEWGTNTGSSYDYGSLDNKNWFSASWSSANFSYKDGNLTSGMGSNGASTHGTNGGSQGVDAVGEIGCSYCHDVHDTAGGANGAPFLRGSWEPSNYPEDGAPLSSNSYSPGNGYADVDAPPRTVLGENSLGGWQIDQNNGNPNSGINNYSQHAGLCTLCHGDGDAIPSEAADVTAIEGLWSGHVNSVAGGSHNGSNNIFSNTIRNGTGNYATGMWMGAMNSTGYSGSWMHGLRNEDAGNGVLPEVPRRPLAYNDFAWSGVTVDNGTVDDSFHNYTCSKCHNPHASRLPRLMITNCLDVTHNTWDDDYTGDSAWSNWNGYTRSDNKEFAYASTAQNCHRYADMPAGGAVEEPGWNSVTPW
jgi:predicted CxxxxCH...CXXCH cytochrome family protein